jgi:hypothetical protein
MTIDHQPKPVANSRTKSPSVCSESGLRRVGPGMSVEETLKRWEADFEQQRMTPEQAAAWVEQERAFAQQMPRR